jgi:mRNA interferase MazF
VIVQADELLGLSMAIIAPTSRSAAHATFRPEIEVTGLSTRVMIEQLRAVDIERLDGFAGRLSGSEQRPSTERSCVLDLS